MTETAFWSILAGLPSLLESSSDEREEHLRQKLTALPDAEIATFDRHFENFISRLYRPDILEAANRLCGHSLDEEGFFKLACGVICLGCERYHEVLEAAQSLDLIIANEMERMACSWRLYSVAGDRLVENTDVFEDEALPADMPQLIERPKLEGLVRTPSVRPKDFPVGSPCDWL